MEGLSCEHITISLNKQKSVHSPLRHMTEEGRFLNMCHFCSEIEFELCHVSTLDICQMVTACWKMWRHLTVLCKPPRFSHPAYDGQVACGWSLLRLDADEIVEGRSIDLSEASPWPQLSEQVVGYRNVTLISGLIRVYRRLNWVPFFHRTPLIPAWPPLLHSHSFVVRFLCWYALL